MKLGSMLFPLSKIFLYHGNPHLLPCLGNSQSAILLANAWRIISHCRMTREKEAVCSDGLSDEFSWVRRMGMIQQSLELGSI